MKPNIKNFLKKPEGVILLAVLGGAVIFASQNILPKKNTAPDEPLAYGEIIKAEDRAPLPVPKEAVKKGRAVKIPILMYHHVGNPPAKANAVRLGMTVSAADFEQQTKWLREQNFNSISLEDIYLFSQGKFTLPKKPVVFTFDDGYEDVFLNAAPILTKYGFSGSFGIITQFAGATQSDNVYASWQQIAQAYLSGQEIVSHTQNHFDGKNPKFNSSYIFQNLSGSIADIQKNLGLTTNILIYPYGHYSSDYIAQAKKAGFAMGVTVHEGDLVNLDNLMEIPRIRVSGHEDLERFKRLMTE